MPRINQLFILLFLLTVSACKNAESLGTANSEVIEKGYQGQPKSPVVPTKDKAIQRQWKGNWVFNDSTTFFTNDFDGARLNGVAYDGNDHYTVWITAENTPINVSPWYAFKVWTENPREITVKLTYQDSRSRYYPKISTDGIHFKAMDSTLFKPINLGEGDFGIKAAPEMVALRLKIDKEPIWISAQELYTSTRVKSWIDSLAIKPFVTTTEIGKSKEGRPMNLLAINADSTSKKAVFIISRQHPPEVTGFLAMKSFIETITDNSELSQRFRASHSVFAIPLMNPDGVDNGHWRHNMGGIDLNRDWQNFNQPETQSVRRFLGQKEKEGYTFVFGADFHSTWDDIYYPLDTTVTGQKGQIVFDWIKNIGNRLPKKKTNVKASDQLDPTMVSRTYFFVNHKMPAIVFELGDNTPRPFLKEKGKVAAEELMQLLLNE